jgi:sugar/nucleoside kinase (ribokinase family)
LLAAVPPRPFDLLGVGECSLDDVLRVAALPPPGGKAVVEDWCERPGGQVATALLTAARLGLRTAYAGVVGDDAAAAQALAPLRAAGVDLSRVEVVPRARTRAAVIAVEQGSGERAVLGYRDPRLGQGSAALAALRPEVARLLLLDATEPAAALELARHARLQRTAVILDLDTASVEAERLLPLADFPIVSESFAEAAYGTVEKALAQMAAQGARLPVVTLGALGSLALWAGQRLASPAHRSVVADTTGAGDVFRGAFAWGLLQGLDVEALLRAANGAAALACRGLGAQGALPDATRLQSFLADPRESYSSS